MRVLFIVSLLTLTNAHHMTEFLKSLYDVEHRDIGSKCKPPNGMIRSRPEGMIRSEDCEIVDGVVYCRYECEKDPGKSFSLICSSKGEVFPRHCDICNDDLEFLAYLRAIDPHKKCRGSSYCLDVCSKHGGCVVDKWNCKKLGHATDRSQCDICQSKCPCAGKYGAQAFATV